MKQNPRTIAALACLSVPLGVVRSGVSAGACLLYGALLMHAGATGEWPAYAALAATLGVDRRTAMRLVRELEEAGLVRRVRQPGGKNGYEILPIPAAALDAACGEGAPLGPGIAPEPASDAPGNFTGDSSVTPSNFTGDSPVTTPFPPSPPPSSPAPPTTPPLTPPPPAEEIPVGDDRRETPIVRAPNDSNLFEPGGQRETQTDRVPNGSRRRADDDPYLVAEAVLVAIAERLEGPRPAPAVVRRHLRRDCPLQRLARSLGVERTAELYIAASEQYGKPQNWAFLEQHAAGILARHEASKPKGWFKEVLERYDRWVAGLEDDEEERR